MAKLAPMKQPSISRFSTAAPLAPARSDSIDPFADVDTAELTLSPELLDALRNLAPKKRPAKLSYVIGLAVIGVTAALGADPSAREIVSARWRGKSLYMPAATATAAPVVVAQLATSEPRVEDHVAPTVSSAANPSPAAAWARQALLSG